MNLFNFFKKSEIKSGALDDNRSALEIARDYQFKEIVTSVNPVNWVEKHQSEWRKFPIRNQDGSGSCVAQTMAKLLGILYHEKTGEFVEFAASFIYKRRSNQGSMGMIGVNAFDIVKKDGATLEVLMPSDNVNETQINAVPEKKHHTQIGELYGIKNYVQFAPRVDFETIASTIQTTGKGVMVWFRFDSDEWTDVPFLRPGSQLRAHHSVTAVDYTLYKGKKALIIEDSWGKTHGLNGQRVITEDFFKRRNTFAAYPIDFKYEKTAVVQMYTFKTTLKFGQKNQDIKELQDILKYDGSFPTNVESTGYYGSITAKAVLAFQKKYHLALDEELNSLQGRIVGPKTISTLNELYGKN